MKLLSIECSFKNEEIFYNFNFLLKLLAGMS